MDVTVNAVPICPTMKILVNAGARYTSGKSSEPFARRKMFACEACKIIYIVVFDYVNKSIFYYVNSRTFY